MHQINSPNSSYVYPFIKQIHRQLLIISPNSFSVNVSANCLRLELVVYNAGVFAISIREANIITSITATIKHGQTYCLIIKIPNYNNCVTRDL